MLTHFRILHFFSPAQYTYYTRKQKKKTKTSSLFSGPFSAEVPDNINVSVSEQVSGNKNKLPSTPADVVLLLLVYSIFRLGHPGVLHLTSNLGNFTQSWFPLIRIKQRASQICEKIMIFTKSQTGSVRFF